MMQAPLLLLTDCLDAGPPLVDAAYVVLVFPVVLQSAVAAVAAGVPCVVAAAAAELVVTVGAVEMIVFGVLVVHDAAVVVVAAGPQALQAAFARGHCFVAD